MTLIALILLGVCWAMLRDKKKSGCQCDRCRPPTENDIP